MEAAAAETRNNIVKDIYEHLKLTPEWKNRNKTQHLYMMCIEADVTVPIMTGIIRQLGIEL